MCSCGVDIESNQSSNQSRESGVHAARSDGRKKELSFIWLALDALDHQRSDNPHGQFTKSDGIYIASAPSNGEPFVVVAGRMLQYAANQGGACTSSFGDSHLHCRWSRLHSHHRLAISPNDHNISQKVTEDAGPLSLRRRSSWHRGRRWHRPLQEGPNVGLSWPDRKCR